MEYKFWEAICEELGLEEYANREDHFPSGQRNAEIRAALSETFAERTREDWLERLDPAVVPVAPVNDPAEVWADPQVQHREMVTSLPGEDAIPMVNTPVRPEGDHEYVRTEHPGLGEHSRELLSEIGVDPATVDDLVTDGVTTVPGDS
jgi:crotonobetainyl-CoA:carnitine CoA-transferase CaiB-like acyl-CoA transferase